MAQSNQGKSLGTVLVVGGCGFLGAAVVDQLLNFPSEDNDPSLPATQTTRSDKSITITSKTQFPSLRTRYPAYDQSTTKVHALDLRCPPHLQLPNCIYHEADITSADALLEVFRAVRPDVVINTVSPQFDAPKPILKKVNIEGTQTLLEVAGGVKHGDWGGVCRAFVHTSSASVIHDFESDLTNADESYPYVCPNPREYYSETKVYAEKMVLNANDSQDGSGMLTCSLRPAGIVGERDRGGSSYSIVLMASIAPLWQLHLQLGNGGNLFDMTYVGNVAHGLLCAAEALLETYQRKREGKSAVLEHERVDGEAFNVTNNEPAYFWDLSRFMWSRYGREIDGSKVWSIPRELALWIGSAAETFNWLTGRKGRLTAQTVQLSFVSRYYSCGKLRARCGYKPLVGVEEGLERSVKYFKQEAEREQAGK